MSDFPPRYDPKGVEDRIYKAWLEKRQFQPEEMAGERIFSIAIPPPNVTGNLTIGHMLDNTFQDLIIRYKRLKGFKTLWLPGMDHAGIATQVKIEERLRDEGKEIEDLGREEFLKIAWQWKEDYAKIIREQLQRLGCALDWNRERFTLDEGLSRAVRLVFVKLYKKGLIYRGRYMVNWCPRCRTALSNEQVVRQEEDGRLYYIKYPIKDGGEVIVATTRPETMLGDTGVAVNPDDERSKGLVGRTAILPIIEREIPIIADDYVDPEFGTGAVKVTPAHDGADLEIGRRHKLEVVEVIDGHGRMTENAGRYQGQDRFECRKQLIQDLKALDYLKKVEPYRIPIARCERCETVIEPRISLQWFVKMSPLVEHARSALENGEIKVFPQRWINLFRHWIDNIKDWCISRQLWWGHPIPVYYCQNCDEIIVSVDAPTGCSCGSKNLKPDPDVLDTWFSSWLWPFSTLGWPEETEDLNRYYPNSMVISGWDILFNWILRMIIAGYEFTGKKPFEDILFHGLIRDRHGRKMSKSLGNSPEPLDLLNKYGADGLRIGLMMITPKEQDILFAEEYLLTGRNFVNKLWNGARMIFLRFPEEKPEPRVEDPFDQWIGSKFNGAVELLSSLLDQYQLNNYTKELYDFVWHLFCDKYLEYLKYAPVEKGSLAKYLLRGILVMAHPIIPFITEEVWQRFRFSSDSIMAALWPEPISAPVDYPVDSFFELVSAVNRARSEWNIHPREKVEIHIRFKDDRFKDLIGRYSDLLVKMVNLRAIIEAQDPLKQSVAHIFRDFETYIPLTGIVDISKEEQRLRDEEGAIRDLITRIEKRLSNEQFLRKAPPEVVEKEKARLSEFREKIAGIERCLKQLAG